MSNLPTSDQPVYRPASTTSSPVIIVLVVLLACSVPTIGILAGLLLPAIQQAREAARRMSCCNNIRQIGLGLLNYESAYKRLPPAYTVDEQGNKLHSWRTLILPFIEQQALYSQIDLSKPWNDPVNAFAMEASIPGYACPSTPNAKNMTTYKVIVDQKCAFPGEVGRLLRDVTDGTSNTVLVFESDMQSAVHWMEPEDASLREYLNNGKTSGTKTSHFKGFHVLLMDCSVRFIPIEIDAATNEAMATANGGEIISGEF